MVNVCDVLASLAGKDFDPVELRAALQKVLLDHRREIPPEIGVHDLFEIALKRRCLVESEQGYRVDLARP